ncbi:MAG: DUF2938 family protein [Ectothiorhodospiraceae bacterium]|nr:DUF2938 family protein [Ectothiorhodospiraceae bacterium]
MSKIYFIIAMGTMGTIFMDVFNYFISSTGLISPINYNAIGSLINAWINLNFIFDTPTPMFEYSIGYLWGGVVHYAIGVIIAVPIILIGTTSLMKIFLYGLSTTLISMVIVYPSIGGGLFASNFDNTSFLVTTSILNHAFYASGLIVTEIIYRRMYVRT